MSTPTNRAKRASVPESALLLDPYLDSIIEPADHRAIEDHTPQPDRFAQLDRRGFLRASALAGGGLMVTYWMPVREARANAESDVNPSAARENSFEPNAYVRITPDGYISLFATAPEIGQGVKTSLPMILAEELDADWNRVRVEQAPIDPQVYGRQSAGGSRTLASSWTALRKAGASARALLIEAAAQRWQVPSSECTTEPCVVVHPPTGLRLDYGALTDAAARIDLAKLAEPTLKDPKDFRILGTRVTGVDNRALVTGQPLFGIDQTLPGLLHAAYVKCPARGGRVAKANLDEVRALPGVRNAFSLTGTGMPTEVMPGVAIVADSTWAVLRAREALRIEWDESSAAKDSFSKASEQARGLGPRGAETLRETGEVDATFEGAPKTVEGFYSYPFVAHAPLEPQNCTAWFKQGAIELWAPTQTPDRALPVIAKVLDIPQDRVTVHQTRAGGGFGRRLINDPMCEAALISQRVGAPIKLLWTREDDTAHDFYRVGGFHRLRGALNAEGKLVAWQDHFISFSHDGKSPVSGGNISETEFPALLVENFHLSQSLLPLATPCGPWRAPRSNAIAFVVQCFMDELACEAGRDQVEFWLELLGEPRWLESGNPYALHTGRAAAVIRLAAEKSGWGEKLAPRHGRGLAFHFSHAGHFAEVAEVHVDESKRISVTRVTVAGDIGPVINPSGAENQCEGAVIDGLSTMLGLALELEDGRISPLNFDRYRLLRMPQTPRVDVHFVKSDFAPSGVGEPALPPLAPAVCNAIFAATGERVRSLPLVGAGFRTRA